MAAVESRLSQRVGMLGGMGGWRPWRQLREQSDVELHVCELPDGVHGICASDPDGHQAILINRRLPPALRLAALAHELVHLERGLMVGLDPVLAAREEQRVDRIVAERLVDLDRLRAWIDARVEVEPVTAGLVADEFGIAPAVAELALLRLRSTG